MGNNSGALNSNWKGGKHSFTCENCDKSFSSYLCGRETVRFCSNKCAHEFMTHPTKGKFGKEHPKWKDIKVMSLNNTIRTSQKYIEWRMFVYGRDSFRCVLCGKKGVWLEAHHKKPLRNIIKENKLNNDNFYDCEQLWDIDNGITLCIECHEKEDKMRNNFKRKNNIGGGN